MQKSWQHARRKDYLPRLSPCWHSSDVNPDSEGRREQFWQGIHLKKNIREETVLWAFEMTGTRVTFGWLFLVSWAADIQESSLVTAMGARCWVHSNRYVGTKTSIPRDTRLMSKPLKVLFLFVFLLLHAFLLYSGFPGCVSITLMSLRFFYAML